jgi:hypothetical protein
MSIEYRVKQGKNVMLRISVQNYIHEATPVTGREGAIDLWHVEAPLFYRQSAHRWRWSCQPYAPAALYPQEDSWYSFLLEAESTPGHNAA